MCVLGAQLHQLQHQREAHLELILGGPYRLNFGTGLKIPQNLLDLLHRLSSTGNQDKKNK